MHASIVGVAAQVKGYECTAEFQKWKKATEHNFQLSRESCHVRNHITVCGNLWRKISSWFFSWDNFDCATGNWNCRQCFLIFYFRRRNFKHAISNCEKMNLNRSWDSFSSVYDELHLHKSLDFQFIIFRQFSNFPAAFFVVCWWKRWTKINFCFAGLIFQLLILQLSIHFCAWTKANFPVLHWTEILIKPAKNIWRQKLFLRHRKQSRIHNLHFAFQLD